MKKLLALVALVLIPLSSFGGQILNLPGVGKVNAYPGRRKLEFISYGGPMEFSVCWNTRDHFNRRTGIYSGRMKCIQSEVGGWAVPAFRKKRKIIPLIHYSSMIIVIGRYNKLASAICRENDGRIGCVTIKQGQSSPPIHILKH